MQAEDYIQQKLNGLKKLASKPIFEGTLEDEIFRLVMSKKFRKYSANDSLQQHIKEAIKINIANNEPISFVFVHGAYKLWRLEESPEVDWAELFSLMYFSEWLKPVAEIYEPGVWLDFFADDYVIPVLNNIPEDEVAKYMSTFRSLIEFVGGYLPANIKITMTGVGETYESKEEFLDYLKKDISEFSSGLGREYPEVSESRLRMTELNVMKSEEQLNDPEWAEKIALVHDAYLALTKPRYGYHKADNKIVCFSQPLPSGTVLALGTTKDSVAKFWVGVGALQKRGDDFRRVILPISRLAETTSREEVSIKGLDGKNFNKIRVLQ